jgi:hypothetical protein
MLNKITKRFPIPLAWTIPMRKSKDIGTKSYQLFFHWLKTRELSVIRGFCVVDCSDVDFVRQTLDHLLL